MVQSLKNSTGNFLQAQWVHSISSHHPSRHQSIQTQCHGRSNSFSRMGIGGYLWRVLVNTKPKRVCQTTLTFLIQRLWKWSIYQKIVKGCLWSLLSLLLPTLVLMMLNKFFRIYWHVNYLTCKWRTQKIFCYISGAHHLLTQTFANTMAIVPLSCQEDAKRCTNPP
jgi:hypothetical protein